MCELPDNYQERVKVTGVSLSYSGEAETMGATIIAQMTLKKSNVNLNLITPHKPSEPYSEDGDEAQCLSDECVERIEKVFHEATDYVNGIRAQGKLFGVSKPVEAFA